MRERDDEERVAIRKRERELNESALSVALTMAIIIFFNLILCKNRGKWDISRALRSFECRCCRMAKREFV
jgi:glutamate/tyrosine decarboxylase-like PLP-dependent enzyme